MVQVTVGVLVLRNPGITWKQESCRRIDIDAAVNTLVERASVEVFRLGSSAVCGQERLPSEAQIHGQPRIHFPRVL